MKDEMREAYVTLGRLSHVKARHGETTAFMAQSLVDAGVDSAVNSAMAKVRGEVSNCYKRLIFCHGGLDFSSLGIMMEP